MRGGLASRVIAAPLHGDRARGGGGEGDEAVERLQRRAAAQTTEGVESPPGLARAQPTDWGRREVWRPAPTMGSSACPQPGPG